MLYCPFIFNLVSNLDKYLLTLPFSIVNNRASLESNFLEIISFKRVTVSGDRFLTSGFPPFVFVIVREALLKSMFCILIPASNASNYLYLNNLEFLFFSASAF